MSSTHHRVVWSLIAGFALAVLASASSASAASIVYADASATGAGDGSSWTNAYTDLSAAITAASSGQEVWVATGTYRPTSGTDRNISFQMKNGVAIYGGFTGTETSLGERDWLVNETILSGDIGVSGDDSDNTYNVIVNTTGAAIDATAVLDGFTIRDGNSFTHGAGMRNNNASPTVRNCLFTANRAYHGGGMYNYNSSAVMTDCRFVENTSSQYGGGVYNEASATIFISCTFDGNAAGPNSGKRGGGMANYYGSNPLLVNCLFHGNTSTHDGGGIMNGNGSPTLINCTFSGNTSGSSGGAIRSETPSVPVLTNCIAWANSPNEVSNYQTTPVITTCHIGGSDPLFVDASVGNFRLQNGSPCIDVGTNSPFEAGGVAADIAFDLGGNARIVRATSTTPAKVDIGSYEYQPAVSVAATPETVSEDGGISTITFTRTGPTDSDLTVLFAVTQTSGSGSADWTLNSGAITKTGGSVTILNGQASAQVALEGITDAIVSGNTVLTVAISQDPAYNVGVGEAAVTLEEAECFLMSVAASPSVVHKDGGQTTLTFSRAGPVNGDLLVAFSVQQTAGAGSADWSLSPAGGSVTILDGQASAQVVLTGITDELEFGSTVLTVEVIESAAYEIASEGGSTLVTLSEADVVYVDASATGVSDGTSWTDAYPDLRAAITATASGQDVWVAAGTYMPTSGTDRSISFQMKNGVGIYGGFTGTEVERDERDWLANETMLSGDIGVSGDNSDNTYNVFVHSSSLNLDATAILDGFTIRDGNNTQTHGGGMRNLSGSPTLRNCVFTMNRAQNGGGLYNDNASPTITNCSFVENASSQYGGGVYNLASQATFINCIFAGNTAGPDTGKRGGGMANYGGSNPLLVNCLFSNNTATHDGGGMINGNGSPTLINCTFSGNTGLIGGGMHNYAPSVPVLINCLLWGNTPNDLRTFETEPIIVTSHVSGADPLFVNAASGNFRLSLGSPCVDKGTNDPFEAEGLAEDVSVDLDGEARFVRATVVSPPRVDIGAYEYAQTVDMGTLALLTPLEISTSPAWIEGSMPIDAASIRVTVDGAQRIVTHMNQAQWYAEDSSFGGPLGVPFGAGTTSMQVVAEVYNEAEELISSINETIHWIPTYIDSDSAQEVIIREGDTLLLTGWADVGQTLEIDSNGDGVFDLLGAPGQTFPVTYSAAGTYMAEAKIDGLHVGVLNVVVMSTSLEAKPIACQVGYTREKHVVVKPLDRTSEITFGSYDPWLMHVAFKDMGTHEGEEGAVISLLPFDRGVPVITARLGGVFGPILSRREVDEFTLDVPARTIAAIDAGSRIGTSYIRMRPYLPNIEYTFDMFASQSTFLGGTTTFMIDTSDTASSLGEGGFEQVFDEDTGEVAGVFKYTLEMPEGEDQICFGIHIEQMLNSSACGGEEGVNPEPCVATATASPDPACVGKNISFSVSTSEGTIEGEPSWEITEIGSMSGVTVTPQFYDPGEKDASCEGQCTHDDGETHDFSATSMAKVAVLLELEVVSPDPDCNGMYCIRPSTFETRQITFKATVEPNEGWAKAMIKWSVIGGGETVDPSGADGEDQYTTAFESDGQKIVLAQLNNCTSKECEILIINTFRIVPDKTSVCVEGESVFTARACVEDGDSCTCVEVEANWELDSGKGTINGASAVTGSSSVTYRALTLSDSPDDVKLDAWHPDFEKGHPHMSDQASLTNTEVDRVQHDGEDVEGVLLVARGEAESFNAVISPEGATWPPSGPQWLVSGVAGTAAPSSGSENTDVVFTEYSQTLADVATVAAGCENRTKDVQVLVADIEIVSEDELNYIFARGDRAFEANIYPAGIALSGEVTWTVSGSASVLSLSNQGKSMVLRGADTGGTATLIAEASVQHAGQQVDCESVPFDVDVVDLQTVFVSLLRNGTRVSTVTLNSNGQTEAMAVFLEPGEAAALELDPIIVPSSEYAEVCLWRLTGDTSQSGDFSGGVVDLELGTGDETRTLVAGTDKDENGYLDGSEVKFEVVVHIVRVKVEGRQVFHNSPNTDYEFGTIAVELLTPGAAFVTGTSFSAQAPGTVSTQGSTPPDRIAATIRANKQVSPSTGSSFRVSADMIVSIDSQQISGTLSRDFTAIQIAFESAPDICYDFYVGEVSTVTVDYLTGGFNVSSHFWESPTDGTAVVQYFSQNAATVKGIAPTADLWNPGQLAYQVTLTGSSLDGSPLSVGCTDHTEVVVLGAAIHFVSPMNVMVGHSEFFTASFVPRSPDTVIEVVWCDPEGHVILRDRDDAKGEISVEVLGPAASAIPQDGHVSFELRALIAAPDQTVSSSQEGATAVLPVTAVEVDRDGTVLCFNQVEGLFITGYTMCDDSMYPSGRFGRPRIEFDFDGGGTGVALMDDGFGNAMLYVPDNGALRCGDIAVTARVVEADNQEFIMPGTGVLTSNPVTIRVRKLSSLSLAADKYSATCNDTIVFTATGTCNAGCCTYTDPVPGLPVVTYTLVSGGHLGNLIGNEFHVAANQHGQVTVRADWTCPNYPAFLMATASVTVDNPYTLSVHPVDDDFLGGKEGRILISALHGGGYYTTRCTTSLNTPAQTSDGQVTITARVMPPDADVTVYFRVIDESDESPYVSGHEGDNRCPQIGGGKLSAGSATTALAMIEGVQCAVAEVTLTITDRYSGDNYRVEASLDSNFTSSETTATLVAWKRVYVECDRMYRHGSDLAADVSAASPDEPSVIHLEDQVFNIGDKVIVFDADHPGGEHASVVDVSSDPNTITLDRGLTRNYYHGYSDNGRGAAVARPIDGVYTANTSRLVNAFGTATDGSDGGCFVEFVFPGAGSKPVPYRKFIESWDIDNLPDHSAFTRMWFANRWRPNYIHLVGAAHCGVAKPNWGLAWSYDAYNYCYVYVEALEEHELTRYAPFVANAGVTAHEIGHQFGLNDHFRGECINSGRWCHMGHTERCLMSYDRNYLGQYTEFCAEPSPGLCIDIVRRAEDGL